MQYYSNYQVKNEILNSMSVEAFGRLAPDLERVDFPQATPVYSAYEKISHVYFPEGAMASIFATTSDGHSAEIGVVGREGAAGLSVLMGVDNSPHDCVVQIPNGAFRIRTAALKKEFERGEEMHDLVLLYTHKLMTQISQITVCNRLHSTEERFARWLLMCHDRIDGDKISLTHDLLGLMLGVRREGVSLTASSMQKAGAISYKRGHITVTDRPLLETMSCECYEVVKDEYDRK